MERDLVDCLLVDSLEYINLAVLWPLRSYEPESRPSAADICRHVSKVANDECARVVRFVASHANTFATCTIGIKVRSAVHAEVQLAVAILDESICDSIAFVEIGHIFLILGGLSLKSVSHRLDGD